MAKNGLELGNRVEIFSKKYRILNDLLLNPKEVLGNCKFIKNEGAQFVNIDLETGEGDYDGVEVLVYSEGQEDTVFLKVTEQSDTNKKHKDNEYTYQQEYTTDSTRHNRQ